MTPDELRKLAEVLPKAKAIRHAIARQDPSMVRRVALEERAALALADLDPPDAARLLADAMEFVRKVNYQTPGWTGPRAWWADEGDSLLARFDRLGEDT